MATIDWSSGFPRIANAGIAWDDFKGDYGSWTGEGMFQPGDPFRNANYKDLQAAGLWSNLGDLDNSPLWQQYFNGLAQSSGSPANVSAMREQLRNDPTAFNNTFLSLGGIDQYNGGYFTPEDIQAIQSAGLTPQQLQMLQGTVTARQQSAADKSFTEKADSAITRGLEIGVPAVLGTAFGGLAGVGPAAQGGTAGSASAGGTAAGGATAGGTALGSGITPGLSATGIGGGATGTGLTAGTTATGIGGGATGTGLSGAAAAGSALAPGYFAAESLYPVVGGESGSAAVGGASGSGGGGGALAPTSTGIGDAMTLAGIARGIPGILGAVASGSQADAYKDLSRDYMAVGAPARARFEASYAPGFSMEDDPGFKDAINQAAKATLHGLSVGGNPAGSPNAWAQSLTDLYQKSAYQALQNYRNQNAAAGGMSALTSAAPSAAGNAVAQQGNVFNGIGAAVNDIFNPPKSLTQILREVRAAGY